ncbi:MAG: UDP-3-O-[3-hydroxymyristoyl] N-acetylglucosamine deacetylase [Planctomycetes bacterium]|nr:UDP-3-O-[3-hydroxymyristoyl] N-acetylglucosamine deacetylase [Planctomycetota bacterium]MBL7041794.1 UDP-3-O-[3-hydroxymyristoyl] N-acetylglucosamine deacetylase [Pirellulaceae bacterium]
MSFRQQRTISRTARVPGFGYWSGRDVLVEFRPALENTGIVFVRFDLDPPQRIAALVQNRIEIPLRTSLQGGEATVEMIEHIMAALAGLRIDNCEVWVNSPEMPGCDGSAQPFVAALESAGIESQPALRERLVVNGLVRVGDDQCWVEARPSENDEFSIQCRIDYGPSGPIGRQTISVTVTPDTFRSQLASARTFILKEEAEWLRSQGLGTRVTYRDLLVFDNDGPIDNALRFTDECVRHKTLDVVGDLALVGCDLVGHFVAQCSGHRLNAELVGGLLAEVQTVSSMRQTA